MNINYGVAKVIAGVAVSVAVGAIVVACGGGGDMGGGGNGNVGGGNPPANIVTTSTTLTNDQEMFDAMPPTNSGAKGTGTLTVNLDTGAISGNVTLESGFVVNGGVHIHKAAAGTTGPIIVPLTQDATNMNVWNVPANQTLDATQLQAFKDGNLYYNAHTAANGNGEIRGQIGRDVFVAFMTGKQAATAATGTGIGLVVLDPKTNTADVSFTAQNLTGPSTAGHIHVNPANQQNGAIVVQMNPTSPGGTTFTATGVNFAQLSNGGPQTLVDELRAGNLYFNVHTSANPSGEIRGQIGRIVRFAEALSGNNQVPPLTSAGSGSGFAVLNEAARTISGSMTINDITPTAAHIHDGNTTTNGVVIVPFTVTGAASPFSASATDVVVSANAAKDFLDGNTYMNVHTAAHPNDGEIRGQLDIPTCTSGC